MSMHDYALNDYGLLLDRDALKHIATCDYFGFTKEDYENDEWECNDGIRDAGIIEWVSEFTGEATQIYDDGRNAWGFSTFFSCDDLYYVPARHMSTLFKAAYKDIDEMIADFKSGVGKYLPEDFDYRNNIRHICGTFYG